MTSFGQKFWTFGGGKGGVGKSFLTASIGMVLARLHKSVIVVDADLGSANLHTFLGIKNPPCTLLDILENGASAEEALLPTAEPSLKLISCAGDILGMANPKHARKEKIIRFISQLEADYILVDLGAGSSYNVLDFFNMSDEGIVIAAPDPASLQNAYAFIKGAIYRRIQRKFAESACVMRAFDDCITGRQGARPGTMLEFYESICSTDPAIAESVAAVVEAYHPLMIINMATSDRDQRVAEIIQSASKRFLNIDIRFCGLITSDPAVRRCVQRLELPDFDDENSIAANQIRRTALRLLNCSTSDGPESAAASDRTAPATPTMGLNDNLEFMGRQFHIQTEDLGYTGRSITTQVFCNGRVLLSTKSQYPDAIGGRHDRSLVIDIMRKQHFNVIRELESKKSQILRFT